MVYLLSIVFSLLLWWANPASVAAAGNIYYVSPRGSASSPCSQSSPCAMDTGLTRLRAGDTLILQAGTYDNLPFNSDNVRQLTIPGSASGSDAARTRIRVANGATVIIYGAMVFTGTPHHITVDGLDGTLILDGMQKGQILPSDAVADHMRLEAFEFRWGLMGIVGGWTNSEFINLDIHHYGVNENGLRTSDCSCAVNDTEHCGVPSPKIGHCHGTYIYAESHDNIWEGISFHDGEGAGMEQYGQSSTYRNLKIWNNYNNGIWLLGGNSHSLVYNNLIYNNRGSGVFIAYGSNNGIYNNTVVGNSDVGVTFQYGGSGNLVVNNILVDNGGGDIGEDGSRHSGSNNLCNSTGGACSLAGNPNFANAPLGDFHLTANAPAVNAGMTVSDVSTDFDKTPRPQGGRFDIGAYEYTGSAPRPLSAPMNLRRASR